MRCACRPPAGRVALAGGLLPLPSSGLRVCWRGTRGGGVAVRAGLDAGSAHHVAEAAIRAVQPHLAEMATSAFNLMHSIADEASTVMDASAGVDIDVGAAVSAAASEAAQAAADASSSGSGGGGVFEFLAVAFTEFLKIIDGGLELFGVPYSYGFSIIVLTIIVKVATFPLTKQQVESSLNMQALQPRMKEMQEKYKNDPERMQQETALLYQEAGVNPLAGCLPTLATIPVFIGLYRALLLAADEGLLKDGFFWIPSLAGPTSIAARQEGLGLSWLFPFVDGAPPVGWDDARAYLILPLVLIISQYISQAIMQQKNTDPSQQGAQALLKFLPLMLGWFSLNVPSGLTLYWITNNILSTGQQVYLKSTTSVNLEAKAASSATMARPPADVIDVTPTGKEKGSRRSPEQIAAAIARKTQEQPRKGEKFRARKMQEAARKAAKLAAERQAALSPENISVADAMEANAPPLFLGSPAAPLQDTNSLSDQQAPSTSVEVESAGEQNGGSSEEEAASALESAAEEEEEAEDEGVVKGEVEAGRVVEAAAVAGSASQEGQRRKNTGKRKVKGR
eukprot:evm.model.scf_1381.2 EVM.evm.TU.scf_1381.2   scf_1381:11340-23080(+)